MLWITEKFQIVFFDWFKFSKVLFFTYHLVYSPFSQSDIIKNPISLFQVDGRCFRVKSLFHLFLRILGSYMVSSRHTIKRSFQMYVRKVTMKQDAQSVETLFFLSFAPFRKTMLSSYQQTLMHSSQHKTQPSFNLFWKFVLQRRMVKWTLVWGGEFKNLAYFYFYYLSQFFM